MDERRSIFAQLEKEEREPEERAVSGLEGSGLLLKRGTVRVASRTFL